MIKFANRMDLMKGSEIRELLKLTAQPDIISFAGGMPAKELFPVEHMKAASNKVLSEAGQTALQYTTTEGLPALREKIVARMKAKNQIECTSDDVLITSGSQQGLDFTGRVFLDKDDVVLMESPSYLGAINAFKTCEAAFIEVPTDDTGMKMDELRKTLETTKNVKFIYVIPDFQNPSGRTWNLERRQQFMEIINEFEIPVIEDNPYGELRFDSEPLPSLKSLDTKGLVIFLGTFSKILAPGYRIGWVCATEKILEKYNVMKQASDLQASTVCQMEVNAYLDANDLDVHVDKIKELYMKRRDCMLKAMDEEFPKECTYTYPTGGLFTWVTLPDYMNAKDLATQCIEKKVAFVPGGSFFPNGGNENTLRMNYSCMPEDKIIEGVKRIAETIKENLK